MEHPIQANAVRFHNIEFSSEGIALLSQNSKLLFVTQKDIRQITLKYGFQSERPVVEILTCGASFQRENSAILNL